MHTDFVYPLLNTPYILYILRCCDGTLYTGITVDLDRRIEEHNTSLKGAKYTQGRRPVVLEYHETCDTKSTALKREIFIKKMTKIQKERLLQNSIRTML